MPISQIILTSNTGGGGGGGGGGGSNTYLPWTVEWFQKSNATQPSTYPRVFGVATYPNQSIGFSLEGIYYGWAGSNAIGTGISVVHNAWQHWAMVSDGTVLSIYKDGVRVVTGNRTAMVANDGDSFYVGIDSGAGNGFKGLITNFRVVKNRAMYDPTQSTITVPTTPLWSNYYTELLLKAVDSNSLNTDSSGKSRTPWGSTNIAWNADTPFTAPPSAGPYTQFSNSSSSDAGGYYILFNGPNYNADLLNVKGGWTVTDGETQSGTVIGDAVENNPGTIEIKVDFNPANLTSWTFTQQYELGGSIETYTSGYGFIGYNGGIEWALDVIG